MANCLKSKNNKKIRFKKKEEAIDANVKITHMLRLFDKDVEEMIIKYPNKKTLEMNEKTECLRKQIKKYKEELKTNLELKNRVSKFF